MLEQTHYTSRRDSARQPSRASWSSTGCSLPGFTRMVSPFNRSPSEEAAGEARSSSRISSAGDPQENLALEARLRAELLPVLDEIQHRGRDGRCPAGFEHRGQLFGNEPLGFRAGKRGGCDAVAATALILAAPVAVAGELVMGNPRGEWRDQDLPGGGHRDLAVLLWGREIGLARQAVVKIRAQAEGADGFTRGGAAEINHPEPVQQRGEKAQQAAFHLHPGIESAEFGTRFIADKWAVVIPALAQDIRLPGAHRADEGFQVPPGVRGAGRRRGPGSRGGREGDQRPRCRKG